MNTFYIILFAAVFVTSVHSEDLISKFFSELRNQNLDEKDREILLLKLENAIKDEKTVLKDENTVLKDENTVLKGENTVLKHNVTAMEPFVRRDTENMCRITYRHRVWYFQAIVRNADILKGCPKLRQTIRDLLPLLKKEKRRSAVNLLQRVLKPSGQRPKGVVKGAIFTAQDAFRILMIYSVLYIDEQEEKILEENHPDFYKFQKFLRETFSCSVKRKTFISLAVELAKLYRGMSCEDKNRFKELSQSMRMNGEKNGNESEPTDGDVERFIWLKENLQSDSEIFNEISDLVFWFMFEMDLDNLPKLEKFNKEVAILAKMFHTEVDGLNDISAGFLEILSNFSGDIRTPGEVISEEELEKAIGIILKEELFKDNQVYQGCLKIMLGHAKFTTPKPGKDITAHYNR